MTTTLDIIQQALENSGTYAPGEILSDADAELGLSVLNQTISKWQMENVYVNQLTAYTLTLVIAKSLYTIGQGQDIDAARPESIQMGQGQASTTISAVTRPVNVVSQLEWTFIDDAAPSVGRPTVLWYDNQFPFGKLNVSPVPSAVGTLTFSANTAIQSFADMTTDITFAYGVREALQDSLALELKPFFGPQNGQIDPVIIGKAAEGKKFILYNGVVSRAMLGRFPPLQARG